MTRAEMRFWSVGNQVLVFFADGKFNDYTDTVFVDFRLGYLPDVNTVNLYASTRCETERLFKCTVKVVVLFDFTIVLVKKAGHFHPVNLFYLLKCHCFREI